MGCFDGQFRNYFWNAVHDIQNDKVQVKLVTKFMLAVKTFHSIKERWPER